MFSRWERRPGGRHQPQHFQLGFFLFSSITHGFTMEPGFTDDWVHALILVYFRQQWKMDFNYFVRKTAWDLSRLFVIICCCRCSRMLSLIKFVDVIMLCMLMRYHELSVAVLRPRALHVCAAIIIISTRIFRIKGFRRYEYFIFVFASNWIMFCRCFDFLCCAIYTMYISEWKFVSILRQEIYTFFSISDFNEYVRNPAAKKTIASEVEVCAVAWNAFGSSQCSSFAIFAVTRVCGESCTMERLIKFI